MKTLKNIFLSLAAALPVLLSCEQKPAPSAPGSRLGFSLSFFKNAVYEVSPSEDTIVSPYSAAVVLSMLAEGAGGETKVELDKALNGCIFAKEDLGSNDTVKVLVSNSLWVDDNFSVRNSYLFKMDKHYDALVETLDFADPATLHAINNWCSEHTEGKITEIIDRLDPGIGLFAHDFAFYAGIKPKLSVTFFPGYGTLAEHAVNQHKLSRRDNGVNFLLSSTFGDRSEQV